MNEDSERQHLLRNSDNIGVFRDANHLNYKKHSGKRPTVIACITLLFLTSFLIIGILSFKKLVPTNDVLINHFSNISTFEVKDISFQGWEYIDKQRYYKLQVKSSFWIDYEKGTDIPVNQRGFISFMGQKVLKEICFDLNTLDTFEKVNDTDSASLASMIFRKTTCLHLTQGTVTELEIPILIKPNTRNLIPLLKRIWEGKYDTCDIWSFVNITFKKKMLSYNIPLTSITITKLNWEDLSIWKSFTGTLRHLLTNINDSLQSIEINGIRLTDSDTGYKVNCFIGLPNLLSQYNSSFSPNLIISPELEWQVSLPDCHDDNYIQMNNIKVKSPEINWKTMARSSLNLSVETNLVGSLPDEFMNHVCSSDFSNVITPMSKFFKKLFNNKHLIDLGVECKKANKVNPESSILENYDEIIEYLNAPLSLNYTVDVEDIVQEVSTRGIKMQWSTDILGRKRLNVKGKIVAKVQIPFYQLEEDTNFSIERLKGSTRLYHDDIHILTIPLDSWTKCSTSVIIDEDSPEDSYFDISFDIDNDQVVIENTLELTHCINEILFKGESKIFLKGKLDIMVESLIGDIVLIGLPGEGETVVRS